MSLQSVKDIKQQLNITNAQSKGVLVQGFKNPLEQTRKVAFKYYKCLNTPVALSCFLLLKYEEYDQLVTHSVDPNEYNDGELFRKDYAATKFLAKCSGLPTSFNLELEALKVEAWAEAKCKQTNRRILKTFPSYVVNRIRNRAIDLIRDILNSPPSFEEICDRFRFGPGTTSATSSTHTTIVDKVGCDLHSTLEARHDVTAMVSMIPGLSVSTAGSLEFCGPPRPVLDSDIVPGNIYGSVPKNAKTNRAIAKPVHMMSGGQLAIGGIIRDKLMDAGIDLRNLWKVNQLYAQYGSNGLHTDGYQYVTVDVTTASSTIAFETIFDLLPRSWALLLDRWREHRTVYGDYIHHNHKFSSMGNGFTFELESLVFYALAKAAQMEAGVYDAVCTSFGDDIITTKCSYDLLVEVFGYYGLTVNPNKSFTNGYFRESCGADYWGNTRINPPYLKELLKNEVSVVKLANRIRDYSARVNDYIYCDVSFRSVWHCLIDLLGSNTQYTFGSKHYGDSVVWCDSTDRRLQRPLFWRSQFFTKTTAEIPCKRRQNRFDNTLGAWAFSDPANRRAASATVPAIGIDLSGPIIGPYSTLYRLLSHREAVVLPTHERGETGRIASKISSSSVMMYLPHWL